MKKIYLCSIIFLIVLFSFFIPLNVKANIIYNIEMDVYIDDDGNAKVIEVWKTNLQQGTEGYKSFSNLDSVNIYNFIVEDDTGRIYTSMDKWKANTSFDEKAYKSGINYLKNGLELCWGISEYGNKTYTLKYNMDNFVTKYTDKQGIYFNLLNLKQYVNQARIIIRSDYYFSFENTKIWSFGYDGEINFVDGNIVMDSKGALTSSEYMVLLMKFENNIFKTKTTSMKSFDDIYKLAFGINDNSKEDISHNTNVSIEARVLFLKSICWLVIFGVLLFLIILFFVSKRSEQKLIIRPGTLVGNLYFGDLGRSLPDDGSIGYYRDIPCDKNLNYAYWVAVKYNLVPLNVLKYGFIGAILLKWIKEEKISVIKTKHSLLKIINGKYAIDFNNCFNIDDEIEKELLRMLILASGTNKVLEVNELYKWCQKSYRELDDWFSNILEKETQELISKGLISDEKNQIVGLHEEKEVIKVRKVSKHLREDAINLKGLKKFLLNFTLISEKPHFEVHIWEEYLIFAQLLGIADEVQEQFRKLYPEIKEFAKLSNGLIKPMITKVSQGMTKAENKANKYYENNSDGVDRAKGNSGKSYRCGGTSAGGSSGGGFR